MTVSADPPAPETPREAPDTVVDPPHVRSRDARRESAASPSHVNAVAMNERDARRESEVGSSRAEPSNVTVTDTTPNPSVRSMNPLELEASVSAPTPQPAPVESIAPDAKRPQSRLMQTIAAPFRSKPVRAAAWFLLIAALPYVHPSLKRLRLVKAPWDHVDENIVDPNGPTGIVPKYGDEVLNEEAHDETPPTDPDHAPVEIDIAPAANAPDPKIPLAEVAVDVGATHRAIEDPTGHALDTFYDSLARADKGEVGAIARVAHYGDSLIVSDYMSSTLRRRFQSRFGDAGHGFLLIAKAWKWYLHYDVSHSSSEGWIVNRIVNPLVADNLYGYGMCSFRAGGGTWARFGTSKPVAGMKDDGFGRHVSRFQVEYLEQPKGGKFELLLDGKSVQTVSTDGPDKKLALADVNTEDGEHTLELRTTGGGEARLFGVTMERDVPGVVWDAIGILGGRARMLDVEDDAFWAQSLRARDPALVVIQYGTNESEDTGYPLDKYKQTLAAVLAQVRQDLPSASCLVVGPMDRAGKGGVDTLPIIPKLEKAQEEVALAAGCAFWDTYLAMGGDGAMGRWVRSKPQLGSGDYTHPTYAGASILGDLLYSALMQGYVSRPKSK